MWNTNTLWFEIAIVSMIFALGHIFFGHFEERTPRWRKLLKYIATIIIILSLSVLFGRTIALTILGLTIIPVVYVHAMWLPKKGINGWTGEPKSKYYDLRGWSKNMFDK